MIFKPALNCARKDGRLKSRKAKFKQGRLRENAGKVLVKDAG